jgi:ADP-heptose:LPS heptosyltransferase
MNLRKKFKTLLTAFKASTLMALASGHHKKYDPALVKNVLVLRYDRIGDMIVTTPFLRVLAEQNPGWRVSVLCSKINAPILANNRSVAETILYRPTFLYLLTLCLKRRGEFDLVIDLNHSVIWHDLILIRLLKPKFAASVFKRGRYGVAGRSLGLYALMSSTPIDEPLRPISHFYLELAQALLGRPIHSDMTYNLTTTQGGLEDLLAFYGIDRRDRIVLVNAHGGRKSMALNYSDILTVTNRVLENADRVVVIWLSTKETHAALSDYFLKVAARSSNKVLLWQPDDTIQSLIALIAGASLLITPDTSLVHIASAFQVPTVAVYANERALFGQWAPRGGHFSHMFSGDPKSLEGYDPSELTALVDQAVARYLNDSE